MIFLLFSEDELLFATMVLLSCDAELLLLDDGTFIHELVLSLDYSLKL